MLSAKVYDFFYLSAMMANIFGLLKIHFFQTPDLPLKKVEKNKKKVDGKEKIKRVI